MKEKIDKNENNMIFHDINTNNKRFTNKIYNYFYNLFFNKKEFKSFFKIVIIVIETLQLISYAFSSIHYNSWKFSEKGIKIMSNFLSSFRLRMFLNYLKYKQYLIIDYIILVIIFILCLIVLLNIIFNKSISKFHTITANIIRSVIDLLSIIFYIPIIEIILIPIKCENGKVYGFEDGEKCWEMQHYINFILGILGTFSLFILNYFMIFFSSFPFHSSLSSIRITSNNDLIILFLKLFVILQNLLISDEYKSLTILLLISIYIFLLCYNNPTYNHHLIETFIFIRNLMSVWTYFVLFITKLFINILINGFIYLLLFGYPIIISLSIILYKEKEYENISCSFICKRKSR